MPSSEPLLRPEFSLADVDVSDDDTEPAQYERGDSSREDETLAEAGSDFEWPDRASDPIQVAAALMLQRAMSERDIQRAREIGSICILITPNESWTPHMGDAWESLVCRNFERADYPTVRTSDGAPITLPRPRSHERALIDGASRFLLIAHDADLIDAHYQGSADVCVAVGPITGEILDEIARAIGDVDRRLPDFITSKITPIMLRLARRVGQSGQDYIDRIERMVFKIAPAPAKPEKAELRWTLENLHGMDQAVGWGRDLCRDLADYRAGKLSWADVDRGALLVGPPGCGKTTFARALASYAGVPLIGTSYGDWESGRDGKSDYSKILKNMRAIFREAGENAPCILFIDELDSVRGRGNSAHNDSWFSSIVNALLAELDGINGREGVVVVGATNRLEVIDPAIVRAGRLDRVIRVDLPDQREIEGILSEHIGCDGDGIELVPIARRMLGRSGADCEMLVRSARRRARNAGRPMVTEDFLAELRASQRARSPEMLSRVAVHEAGHALVSYLQSPGSLITVSALAQGAAAGGMWAHVPQSEALVADIDDMIRVLLGGRAAEVAVLGSASAGSGGPAGSDLSSATVLAAAVEVEWCIGDMGISWRGEITHENVSTFLLANRDLAQRVDQRLRRVFAEAVDIVRRHRVALVAIADALLEREILDASDVALIIAAHPGLDRLPGIPPRPRIVDIVR